MFKAMDQSLLLKSTIEWTIFEIIFEEVLFAEFKVKSVYLDVDGINLDEVWVETRPETGVPDVEFDLYDDWKFSKLLTKVLREFGTFLIIIPTYIIRGH